MNRLIDILVKSLPINDPMRIAAENSQDENLKYCLLCKEWYEPIYSDREEAMASKIPVAMEQWISGCCSDKCWDENMGSEE